MHYTKDCFLSYGCKNHIFIYFYLVYCWHILANKQHYMHNTKYNKFILVVRTLFLNKWYLRKPTFLRMTHMYVYKTGQNNRRIWRFDAMKEDGLRLCLRWTRNKCDYWIHIRYRSSKSWQCDRYGQVSWIGGIPRKVRSRYITFERPIKRPFLTSLYCILKIEIYTCT